MNVVKADIWTYITKADALCVTTNGFVKWNGHAVMGRGIAFQACNRYPRLDLVLGDKISREGNQVYKLTTDRGTNILSFPTKPIKEKRSPDGSNIIGRMRDQFKPGEFVPGWALKSNLSLIARSAKELLILVDKNPEWKLVVLPKPGCTNGELTWKDVEPVLDQYLSDERFLIVDLM